MTLASVELLLLLAVMGVLFLWGKVPVDFTALLGLLILILGKFISPEEAFSGFSSPAVIAMTITFFISAAIRETGLAYAIGSFVGKSARGRESLAVLGVVLLASFFSAFMNNVVAGGLLLPVVMHLARVADIAPSRLLIPLAFGTIFGGMTTLIGTPPNIVASEILVHQGLAPLSFFSYFLIGIAAVFLGALTVVLFRRFLPENGGADSEDDISLDEVYHIKEKLFSVRVPHGSSLVGKSLAELELGRLLGCRVVEITRGADHLSIPTGDARLQGDDILILRGNPRNIAVLENAGALTGAEHESTTPSPLSELVVESEIADSNLESKDVGLVEVVLSPRSRLVGKGLRDLNFRQVYGFLVLAIWRAGEVLYSRLGDLTLAHGDALLLQGPRNRMPHLVRNHDFIVLSRHVPVKERGGLAKWVALALVAMLGLSASGLFPFYVVALMIALSLVLIGSVTMEEGYRHVEWRIVLFTGALIPFGVAVQRSGLSDLLATSMVTLVGQSSPYVALALLGLATSFVSQLLDATPAVILFGPVGIQVAKSLGLSPYPFVIGTAMFASVAFLTPFSQKVNLLVMGAGGYKTRDYLKIGIPVSIVVFLVVSIVTPIIFPF